MVSLKDFWHRIVVSWNPAHYGQICDVGLKEALWHVPAVAGVAFLLWVVLAIPAMMGMANTVESQLNAFTSLEIGGTVEMVDSVGLPSNNPRFVIDVNDESVIETETIKITRKYIYLNTLGGASRIPIEKIQKPLDYKTEFGQFSALIALLLMPAVVFWGYLSFLIKYALIIGVTICLSLFVTHILLIGSTSWKRVFNVCVYGATPMVLLETLITPINGSWLMPLFDVMGVNFYGLSMAVYWGLAIAGIVMIEKSERPGKWNF